MWRTTDPSLSIPNSITFERNGRPAMMIGMALGRSDIPILSKGDVGPRSKPIICKIVDYTLAPIVDMLHMYLVSY